MVIEVGRAAPARGRSRMRPAPPVPGPSPPGLVGPSPKACNVMGVCDSPSTAAVPVPSLGRLLPHESSLKFRCGFMIESVDTASILSCFSPNNPTPGGPSHPVGENLVARQGYTNLRTFAPRPSFCEPLHDLVMNHKRAVSGLQRPAPANLGARTTVSQQHLVSCQRVLNGSSIP